MQNNFLYSRRELLKKSAVLTGLAALGLLSLDMIAPEIKEKYKIGACDWSLGKQDEVEALALAKKIGLDGVMVGLGSVANNMHLRQKEVQKTYLRAAKKFGMKISSLAIGELNKVPYKSEPETEEWVSDSIDVAEAMGCKVILLAFFNKGDLRGDEAGIREVIRRLKKVAPKAEKAGVILGIESWLNADEHLRIIHAIGSKNVRVYYDVSNSHNMGYDIYKEMSRLSKEYICEVHAKENGCLLGQGKIDFEKVKKILDNIGYEGWIIMEGAVPPGANLFDSYVANNKYIRSVFNP
jgi:sugar phosphate isomerase/epimerase